MDLVQWTREVAACTSELSELDFGYPQGKNDLLPPASPDTLHSLISSTGLSPSSPLVALFQVCGGVSLPDVHVGYFIHSPGLILKGLANGEPRRITGRHARDLVVFGTDGGGGRFAIGIPPKDEVLYLGEGSVHSAVFDGRNGEVRILAAELFEFLENLLSDIRAFIRDDRSWRYMV